ncbi:MAG: alpha/beta hydrolase family protein [Microthrixaceae bacterium]
MTIDLLRRRLGSDAPELDEAEQLAQAEFEPGSITLLNRVEKGIARWPMARLTTVAPRTMRWALEAGLTEAGRIPGAPQIRMTGALAAHVAMDEAVMALVQGPSRSPRRADYLRVGQEVATARQLFEDRGWIDDPRSYHSDPPALDDADTSSSRGWALGQSYRWIEWESGYEPREEEPGATRWAAFERNRTAAAWLLEHDHGERPWMVAVHGFGTGAPMADIITFRALHIHHELGWNVAAIVLPVHGRRRPSRIGGEDFLGFDMMNCVHAVSQSVWDVRRLLSWVRDRGPTAVALHGVSLGGYVSSLTSCFEGELDAVIAGIPVCDFPALFAHQAPDHVRERAVQHGILEGNVEPVHRVVSPLAMDCLVPWDRRFIFAGLGDRMAVPAQAQALWEHWDEPSIRWFPGNHLGYLWSSKVADYVDGVLKGL